MSLFLDEDKDVDVENKVDKTSLEMAEELAKDYADYARVDIHHEKKLVEEATDELLTKLEELMSLVDLIRSDTSQCLNTNLPKIKNKCKELEKVFHNIDKLEAFVDMVRENVEIIEVKVIQAEKDLLPEKSISKLLKPLFSKKVSPRQPKSNLNYEPPTVFDTKKHFKHHNS